MTRPEDHGPARTIDEVVARLQRLAAELAPGDGVRWFNRLYLEITLAVREYCRTQPLKAQPFLPDLDVHFGNRYFAAFDAASSGGAVPACWAPLFRARADHRIAPLQFALAGMNAHIGHDLALGVVAVCEQLGRVPGPDTPEHDDYGAVDTVLQHTEARMKTWLLTGAIKELDHVVAPLDDAAVIWSIKAARQAAWTRAQVLWQLRDHRTLSGAYLAMLDRTVGMESAVLLLPHAPV